MENAIKKRPRIGRPITLDPNTKYGFIKINQSIHKTLKSIARKEERNIQTVTERILRRALEQDSSKELNSNK